MLSPEASLRRLDFITLPRWQRRYAVHLAKRRLILTGRFIGLHDKLSHQRSEFAHRRFGPWRDYERCYPRIAPLCQWSRRASMWRTE